MVERKEERTSQSRRKSNIPRATLMRDWKSSALEEREIKGEWCEISGTREGGWHLFIKPFLWILCGECTWEHKKRQGDQIGGCGREPGEDGAWTRQLYWRWREADGFKRCLGVWALTWGRSWDDTFPHHTHGLSFTTMLENPWPAGYLFSWKNTDGKEGKEHWIRGLEIWILSS